MILLPLALVLCLHAVRGRGVSEVGRREPVVKRHLENKEVKEILYDYELEIEELVDDSAQDSTQEVPPGPEENNVICIEASMASHTDQLAEKFVIEKYDYWPQPHEWEVKKIDYHPEDEQIEMTVKNDRVATVKVYNNSSLTKKEKVWLDGKAPPGSSRGLSEWKNHDADQHEATASGRTLGLRNELKRLWKKKFRLRVRCRKCLLDNFDAGRRTEEYHGLRRTVVVDENFEGFMNTHLQDEVNIDCMRVLVTGGAFHRVETDTIPETIVSEPTTTGDSQGPLESGKESTEKKPTTTPDSEPATTGDESTEKKPTTPESGPVQKPTTPEPGPVKEQGGVTGTPAQTNVQQQRTRVSHNDSDEKEPDEESDEDSNEGSRQKKPTPVGTNESAPAKKDLTADTPDQKPTLEVKPKPGETKPSPEPETSPKPETQPSSSSISNAYEAVSNVKMCCSKDSLTCNRDIFCDTDRQACEGCKGFWISA